MDGADNELTGAAAWSVDCSDRAGRAGCESSLSVAASAYRLGDDRPMIARTSDGGKTWTNISGDLPVNDPVETVREDPVNPKLLYAGTHFGLFASFDQGTHWVRVGDMPPVRSGRFADSSAHIRSGNRNTWPQHLSVG